MKYFAHYESKTGRIVIVESWAFNDLAPTPFGTADSVIEVPKKTKPRYHFIDNGEVADKKPLYLEPKVKDLQVSFKGVPREATISVGNYLLVTKGRETNINFDFPGFYLIEFFNMAQYLDSRVEVKVG